jgi:enoyl-CoA hydratase/carnithine racemase
MPEAIAVVDVAQRLAAGGLQGLYQAVLVMLRSSADCRCIVLHFHGTDAVEPDADEESGLVLMRLLLEGGKPVIAAVEGGIADAALSLAAAADYVVAAADARFSSRYMSTGVLPATGLLWGLSHKLGVRRARALVVEGQSWDAAAAADASFAQEVVAGGQALVAALAVARRYLARPLQDFAGIKPLWAASAGSLEQAQQAQPLMAVHGAAAAASPADTLRVCRAGAVAVIECSAPDGGPRALAQQLRSLDGDGEVRAIVLACSMFEAPSYSDTADSAGASAWAVATLTRSLLTGSKPVIAAVEGRVSGEAAWLALGADFIVAADDAVLSAERLFDGSMPDAGRLWSLRRKAAAGALWAWLWQGDQYSAAQARRLGLIQELAPAGTVQAAAMALAGRIATMAPLSLALLKAGLLEGADTPARVRRTETDLQPLLRRSADHAEAVAAFLEKRPPRFHGL